VLLQWYYIGTPTTSETPSSFDYEKVTKSKAKGSRGGISHQTKTVGISKKVELLY